MTIEYDCANCRQRLAVSPELAGQRVQCPHCQQATTVPLTSTTAAPQPAAMPTPAAEGDVTGGLIPYKNSKALVAYYLGVFSLIPCLGLPLGIVALVLGIMGLKYAKQHPESRGQVHAWVGVLAGGLFALLNLAGIVLLLATTLGSAAALHR